MDYKPEMTDDETQAYWMEFEETYGWVLIGWTYAQHASFYVTDRRGREPRLREVTVTGAMRDDLMATYHKMKVT